MEVDDDDCSNVENLKSIINGAQNEVKSNSYNYDGYVKLISSLSKLYSIYKARDDKSYEQAVVSFNKLRNARKSMAAVYPLSVDLWTQWIEDELRAPAACVNHKIIEEIFSKAVLDYISVDIWCLYVKYLINRRDSDSCDNVTITFIREIFEKAIINCGLHYQEGHKIWEAYQQFEEKLLLEAEEKLKKSSTLENIENCKTQFLNFIKVFKRQMHVPLAKHDELFVRFVDTVAPHLETLKLFTADSKLYDDEEFKSIHSNTLDTIKARSIDVKENYLEECQHSLEAYQSYINHELDTDVYDPSRVQCLFERAIVYHCLKSNIWLDYINFLNVVLKQSDLAITVCKRALRNVTWDSRLYVKYAAILEQNFCALDEIKNVYEMGLEKYSDNGFNYCNVWMSYVSFEKRMCDNRLMILKKRKRIYELIQKALRQFEVLADPDKFVVEFMIFWMNIEKFWFDDETKNEIILKYFGIKYRKNDTVWYQIVTFARAFGIKNLVNDLYNIGLGEFPDSFEQFGQNWLNFENVCGNSSSCNNLEKKINIHIPSCIHPRKTKECLSIKSKTEHQNNYLIGWLNRAENHLFSVAEASKPLHPIPEESTFAKKSRGFSKNKMHFVPKTEPNGDEEMADENTGRKEDLKTDYENVTIKSESNTSIIGPVIPPGFVKSNNDEENDDDLIPPPKKLKFIEKNQPSKNISESENDEHKRTVYVSNLHPATSESDLKIIFGRAGNVQKVDLHRQKGGKIFAFVIFSKPEEAQNAFELEHTPIRNRPVFVSKFNRSKEKHNVAPYYSQQQEKNKLFVSNLDKSTTPNDLEKLFNRHGDMISLRLINKKGSSKPFAYVEYKNEDDAARYRNEVNNAIVRGRQIVVEFSNPGKANQSDRQRQIQVDSSSLNIPEMQEKKIDSSTEDTVPVAEQTTDEASEAVEKKPTVDKSPDKSKSKPFGLIPLQVRTPRSQPLVRKPKGPAVRLNVTAPVNTNDNSVAPSEKPLSSENGTKESASKSNDDFRRMLLNK